MATVPGSWRSSVDEFKTEQNNQMLIFPHRFQNLQSPTDDWARTRRFSTFSANSIVIVPAYHNGHGFVSCSSEL